MWPALCSLSRLPWQWFRFSLSGPQTSPGILFIPLAWWDKLSRTGQKYQFSLKKTVLSHGVNFIFTLWGQGWNKREVIYSSLIGTTLPLFPYLSASVPKEWFHDFCPSKSQETDVGSVPAFSVQDWKHDRESARWHFVCTWTCSLWNMDL